MHDDDITDELMRRFNLVWKNQATAGACDAYGSAEWERRLAEYLALSTTDGIVSFIAEAANRPASSPRWKQGRAAT